MQGEASKEPTADGTEALTSIARASGFSAAQAGMSESRCFREYVRVASGLQWREFMTGSLVRCGERFDTTRRVPHAR